AEARRGKTMADEENTTPEEQALADEWAAALAEAGDAGQDDIDAMLAAQAPAQPAAPRAPMEEFGSAPPPSNNLPANLDGPNVDVILDSRVSISMGVGNPDSAIRKLLRRSQGSGIELDRGAREPLDVLGNGTLIAHGE